MQKSKFITPVYSAAKMKNEMSTAAKHLSPMA